MKQNVAKRKMLPLTCLKTAEFNGFKMKENKLLLSEKLEERVWQT
jgi:hypothetical protein